MFSDPSQFADLVQAFAAMFTALGVLLGGVAALVKLFRGRRGEDDDSEA